LRKALITTAAGLFTAIPAVIAYNHFLHNIKDLGGRMDGFTLEVAATIEKLYPWSADVTERVRTLLVSP